jgi:hypothetical protein
MVFTRLGRRGILLGLSFFSLGVGTTGMSQNFRSLLCVIDFLVTS